jgi:NADPH:quinone reductase-like Zn-dependent oxidoreductase
MEIQMKAARLQKYGDVDQIKYEEIEKPVAGSGQVLVKVEASSLNPVELYLRQGFLAKMIDLKFPLIMGLDLAGKVEAVGPGVTNFKAGDRVIGKLPINGNGSNQEYVVATPAQLAKIADNISYEAGATLPLAGLTGRQAVDAINPKKGDRILVTGALGAVGRAAVQYLQERGAIPVAGVRASRLAEAKSLGIEAVDMDEPNAKTEFAGAVSTVGGDVMVKTIKMVRKGGKMAAITQVPEGANADGRIEIIELWAKDVTKTLEEVAAAAASGKLHIPIAKTLKLSEVGEGHKLMAAGKVGGKILFVP